MNRHYDYSFKVLLIGDSGVGKTCLMARFTDEDFSATYISTIGVDFKVKTVKVNKKTVKLQIWDTAGQERFQSTSSSYYRGAHGIAVVYDCTRAQSFNNVKHWLNKADTLTSGNVDKLLVGNKSDMIDEKVVHYSTAKAYADGMGIPFVETSAKSSHNVDEMFLTLVSSMLENRSSFEVNPSVKLTSRPLGVADRKTSRQRC